MRSFISKIRRKINNKRCYGVLSAVMAVVVATSVYGSLIMPAISMSRAKESAPESIFYTEGRMDPVDIGPYVSEFNAGTTGSSVTFGDVNGEQIPFDMNLRFTIPAGQSVSDTYIMNLDDHVTIDGVIEGDLMEDGIVTGHLKIENGVAYLTNNEEYFKKHDENNDGIADHDIPSFFRLSGTVNRKEDEVDQNIKVQFGGQELTVDFGKPKSMTITKSVSSGVDANGNITWTLKVLNPGKTSLGDLMISDSVFAETGIDKSQMTQYGTFSGDKFYFKDGIGEGQTVVELTYTQPLPKDKYLEGTYDSIDNTAKLSDKDDTTKLRDNKPIESSKSTQMNANVNLSKTAGTPTYNDDGSATIEWTVTVTNPNGMDLDGLTVTDEKLKGYTGSFSGCKFDKTTGVITFDEGSTNTEYNFTYTTVAKDSSGYSNTARLETPGGKYKEVSAKANQKVEVGKRGEQVGGEHSIRWTVTLKDNSEDPDLSGYVIADEMLEGATNLKIDGKSYAASNPFTIPEDFKGDGYIEVSYETNVTKDQLDASGKGTFINEVGIDSDGQHFDTSAKVDFTWRYEASKGLDQNKAKVVTDGDKKYLEIPWTVTIKGEKGDFADGLEIPDLDKMTASSSGIDLKHFVSSDMLDRFKVTTDSDGRDPVDSFKVTGVADGKQSSSFGIEVTDSDCSQVVISYISRVDVTDIEIGKTIRYSNTADIGNGKPQIKDGTFEMKESLPYVKKDGDVDVSGDSNVKTGNLGTAIVDGVECYLMKWKIEIPRNSSDYMALENGSFKNAVLTDVLPENTFLYEDGDLASGYAVYVNDTNNSNGNKGDKMSSAADVATADHWFPYHYDKATRKLTLGVKAAYFDGSDGIVWVNYTVAVPKTIVDNGLKNGSISFSNTVKDEINDFKPSTQVKTIVTSLVDKKAVPTVDSQGKSTGEVTYTVEVNPGSLDLSTGDKIVLYDQLKNQGMDAGALNADLTKIEVSEIDADGNEKPLEIGNGKAQYNYDLQSSDTNTTVTPVSIEQVVENHGGVDYKYKISGLACSGKKCEKVTVNLSGGTPGQAVGLRGYALTTAGEKWFCVGNQYNSSLCQTFDENGKATIVIDWTEGISDDFNSEDCSIVFDTFVFGDSGSVPGDTVTVENNATKERTAKDYIKQLKITIPDQKHLKIKYVYKIYNEEMTSVPATVKNSISINSEAASDSSSATSAIYLAVKGLGGQEGAHGVTLRKTATGSIGTKVGATFAFAHYNSKSGKWELMKSADYTGADDTTHPCDYSSFEYNTDYNGDLSDLVDIYNSKDNDADRGFKSIVAVDGDTEIGFSGVVEGDLYALVELETPEKYIKLNAPKYFSYIKKPGTLPSNVKSDDVELVTFGGSYHIKNAQNINITAKKVWDGKSADDVKDLAVNVKLYSSSEYMSGNAIDVSALKPVENGEYTLNEANSWTFTRSDLPNGDDEGEPIYYYVLEESYTKNGDTIVIGSNASEYVPQYANNGLNESDTITVTNYSGFSVRKVWLKDDGTEFAAGEETGHDQIKFKLYTSTSKPANPNITPAVETLTQYWGEGSEFDEDGAITLSADNGWKFDFDTLPLTDADGNTLYYYVIEDNVKGYKASYVGNGRQPTGEVVIKNTYVPGETVSLSVQKLWSDTEEGANHSGDKVTANIWRTTDPSQVPTDQKKFDPPIETYKVELQLKGNNDAVLPFENDGSTSESFIIDPAASGASVSFATSNIYTKYGTKFTVFDSSGSSIASGDVSGTDVSCQYFTLKGFKGSTWGSYDGAFTLEIGEISQDIKIVISTLDASTESWANARYKLSDAQPAAVNAVSYSMARAVAEKELYKTVDITADNDWTLVLEGLPKTSILGDTYYYWIEETAVNGQAIKKTDYSPSYAYSGSSANNSIDLNAPTAVIYNKKQNQEGRLPETGGIGTAPYFLAGGAVTAASLALLALKRRKRLNKLG